MKNVAILTPLEKMVLPVAPLLDLGVDYGVFDTKIWIFWTRVLILRSQSR